MLRLGCSQETIDLTLHPMIAWFDQHLRPEVKVRLAPYGQSSICHVCRGLLCGVRACLRRL